MAPDSTPAIIQGVPMRMRPEHQVFINCPFDDDYKKLMFEPMVFAVQACGFMTRCALEATLENDRFKRIQDLVEICPVSIHDLSRNRKDEDPRFNMPLELGLFIGCKRYGGQLHDKKSYLILDREKYIYQRYISDINGQDPSIHFDKPEKVVEIIRNWLSYYFSILYSGQRLRVPSATKLYNSYKVFLEEKESFCNQPEFDLDHNELTFLEQREIITAWWEEKLATYEILKTALDSEAQAREVVAKQQTEPVKKTDSEQDEDSVSDKSNDTERLQS
jgi:hypothetical protein